MDWSVDLSYRRGGEDQQIAHALIIAFVMVVLHEPTNRPRSDGSPNENQAVQTRFLDCPDQALRVRVEIRGKGRQADDLHACGSACLTEPQSEQRVPIVESACPSDSRRWHPSRFD